MFPTIHPEPAKGEIAALRAAIICIDRAAEPRKEAYPTEKTGIFFPYPYACLSGQSKTRHVMLFAGVKLAFAGTTAGHQFAYRVMEQGVEE